MLQHPTLFVVLKNEKLNTKILTERGWIQLRLEVKVFLDFSFQIG
jgi:hypothetical protein